MLARRSMPERRLDLHGEEETPASCRRARRRHPIAAYGAAGAFTASLVEDPKTCDVTSSCPAPPSRCSSPCSCRCCSTLSRQTPTTG